MTYDRFFEIRLHKLNLNLEKVHNQIISRCKFIVRKNYILYSVRICAEFFWKFFCNKTLYDQYKVKRIFI